MRAMIIKAEKDEENSCMIITTEHGQEWVSCAECRIGEVACNYLKRKWGIDPCLYRRGVRVGRGLEPDPNDVVKIVQNNLAIYNNLLEDESPFLRAEKEILDRFLKTETEELEKAKSMLYNNKP